MIDVAEEYARYLIMGKEKAPTTGTRHLQGYCEFPINVRKSLRAIRKVLPVKIANVEPRYAELPKEAAGYCKKGKCEIKPPNGSIMFSEPHENFDGYEFGEIAKLGERNDIEECTQSILRGDVSGDEFTLFSHRQLRNSAIPWLNS